jgi:hypothetical protein
MFSTPCNKLIWLAGLSGGGDLSEMQCGDECFGVTASSSVNIFSLHDQNDLVTLLYSPRIQVDDTVATEPDHQAVISRDDEKVLSLFRNTCAFFQLTEARH